MTRGSPKVIKGHSRLPKGHTSFAPEQRRRRRRHRLHVFQPRSLLEKPFLALIIGVGDVTELEDCPAESCSLFSWDAGKTPQKGGGLMFLWEELEGSEASGRPSCFRVPAVKSGVKGEIPFHLTAPVKSRFMDLELEVLKCIKPGKIYGVCCAGLPSQTLVKGSSLPRRDSPVISQIPPSFWSKAQNLWLSPPPSPKILQLPGLLFPWIYGHWRPGAAEQIEGCWPCSAGSAPSLQPQVPCHLPR